MQGNPEEFQESNNSSEEEINEDGLKNCLKESLSKLLSGMESKCLRRDVVFQILSAASEGNLMASNAKDIVKEAEILIEYILKGKKEESDNND